MRKSRCRNRKKQRIGRPKNSLPEPANGARGEAIPPRRAPVAKTGKSVSGRGRVGVGVGVGSVGNSFGGCAAGVESPVVHHHHHLHRHHRDADNQNRGNNSMLGCRGSERTLSDRPENGVASASRGCVSARGPCGCRQVDAGAPHPPVAEPRSDSRRPQPDVSHRYPV